MNKLLISILFFANVLLTVNFIESGECVVWHNNQPYNREDLPSKEECKQWASGYPTLKKTFNGAGI